MTGISLSSSGSFDRTEKFVRRAAQGDFYKSLARYGAMGVAALSAATPRDTGAAAGAWTFEVVQNGSYKGIKWLNTDVENGFHVAIMIQYGHGTRNGGYVQGRDYINPAIKPVFDQIAEAVWREVTRA